MKLWLYALAMCQSMFCAIPCPWHVWDEQARGRMLLCLPLLGLELGVLWAALACLCRLFVLPELVTALLLSVYPFVISGYIHLDGYMDVTDAVRSCRSPERRREILKDPHVGSFAVIGVVLLLLAQFVVFSVIDTEKCLPILLLLPAVSRCCSALAVCTLRPMDTSQYAGKQSTQRGKSVLSAFLAVLLAVGFFLAGWRGLALPGCVVGYCAALCRGYRSLNGMNGDISGYALTMGEFCGVAVLAAVGRFL